MHGRAVGNMVSLWVEDINKFATPFPHLTLKLNNGGDLR